MKIYYHPASTTSRPIMLFAAEAGIHADFQVVDLFTGEHYKPPYEAINPNHLVPVLEDGDFRLTESSAILKYLAEKAGSPAYPKDLKERARINERDGLDQHAGVPGLRVRLRLPADLPDPQAARATRRRTATLAMEQGARAGAGSRCSTSTLLGTKNAYLCGDRITLADYFGAPFVALGHVVRSDFAGYPNVQRWLQRMQALPNWKKVNETIDGYAASLKEAPLQPI